MTTKVYPEYATSDITLASFLKENGNTLDRIQIDGNKGIFYFLEVEEAILFQYELGSLWVEPKSFHSTIKTLVSAVNRQVGNYKR